MKPTRGVTLAAFGAFGVASGWVAVVLVGRLVGRILVVPWPAAAALWVLALAVVAWALVSRPALVDPDRRRGGSPVDRFGRGVPAPVATGAPTRPRKRRRMDPLVAARTAALAMAASRTGAVIGGFYLGVALAVLPDLSTPSGSQSFSAALTSVVACAVLVVAALWLESMCRLRDLDR